MLFVKTSLLVLLLATVQASNQGFDDHVIEEDPEEAAFVDAFVAAVAATQEGAPNFEDRVLEDRDLGFLARGRARICNRKLANCQAQAKDLSLTKWKNQIEGLNPEDPIGLQSNLRVLVDLTENADYTGYVTDILTRKNKITFFQASKLLLQLRRIRAPRSPSSREDFIPTVESLKEVAEDADAFLLGDGFFTTFILIILSGIGGILAIPIGLIGIAGLVVAGLAVTAAIIIGLIVGGLVVIVLLLLGGLFLLLISPIILLIIRPLLQGLGETDELGEIQESYDVDCEASLLKCEQDKMAATIIPTFIRFAQMVDGDVDAMDPPLFTP